jgi:hypothetical protein
MAAIPIAPNTAEISISQRGARVGRRFDWKNWRVMCVSGE